MEAIKNVVKAQNQIKAIENQLFTVVKTPLITNLNGFDIDEAYAMHKHTGGSQLGIVGKDFNATQPKAIFDALCDTSLQFGLDLEDLKFHEMKDGKKIRFTLPIGKVEFINPRKALDTTVVSLNIQTGFDGQTANSMYLSTYRMICANGMKASMTEFSVKFRNTLGNEGKVIGMLDDVAKAVSQVQTLDEMYLHLNNVKVNKKAIELYIERIFGYKAADYPTLHNASKEVYDNVMTSIELEIGRTGATAFGLFNGITHYTNHVAKGHENSDYLYTEQGAKTNDKALKELLLLIK